MDPIISKISGGGNFPTANSANTNETKDQDMSEVSKNTKVFPGLKVKPFTDLNQQIADLQKMIDAIQGPKRVLEVSVHQETHAIMIKVLNEQTGDVIREIPPERRLDVAAKMMELAGIIVDKRV